MKFEELLSSKYVMFAFIGLCAGILALTAVEVGDDFIPALVLSLVNLTAGVLVLVQLKRRFAPTAVLFFVLSVFSILFCLDGFFEDLSEVFLILCGAAGFLMTLVSVFLLLVSYQKKDEENNFVDAGAVKTCLYGSVEVIHVLRRVFFAKQPQRPDFLRIVGHFGANSFNHSAFVSGCKFIRSPLNGADADNVNRRRVMQTVDFTPLFGGMKIERFAVENGADGHAVRKSARINH